MSCNKVVDNVRNSKCEIWSVQNISIGKMEDFGHFEVQIETPRGWSGFYGISYSNEQHRLINDSTYLLIYNLTEYLTGVPKGEVVRFRCRIFSRKDKSMFITPIETLTKP